MIHKINYKNEDIIEKGRELKKEVLSNIINNDGLLMGYLSVKSPELQKEVDVMDKLRVVNRFMTSTEFRMLFELYRLLDDLKVVYDINYNIKRLIIRAEDKHKANMIMNYFAKQVLEDDYGWSIRVYDDYQDTSYITIDKVDYTYKLFKKEKRQKLILLNKYFVGFDNGDNVYFIDFGKIGEKTFTVDNIDFLLITHSHIDHIGSFLLKENQHLKPVIYTNLPTLELLTLRKTDFDMRDDLEELFKQSFVNNKTYFDDLYAEQFLSGHDYGSNFYIENYSQGFSALYITDTNIKSRAFKSRSIGALSKYDVDILFVEFPLHRYRPSKIPVKDRYIIGTTSGEYEELLIKLPPDEKIMVDVNNSMYNYEKIRQKYKSYLSRELNSISVEPGTFYEFLHSDYKYFFTTKGYALMYTKKYRGKLNKYGVKTYLTNTKTDAEGVGILSVKTHINISETMSLIKAVQPRAVIFTHYNGSKLLYKILPQVENIVGQGNVFTCNPEGEWVKLKIV